MKTKTMPRLMMACPLAVALILLWMSFLVGGCGSADPTSSRGQGQSLITLADRGSGWFPPPMVGDVTFQMIDAGPPAEAGTAIEAGMPEAGTVEAGTTAEAGVTEADIPDAPPDTFVAPTQDGTVSTSDGGAICLEVKKDGNKIITSGGLHLYYTYAVFFHGQANVLAINEEVTGNCTFTQCEFNIPPDLNAVYWDSVSSSWQNVMVRYRYVQFYTGPYGTGPLHIPSCNMQLTGMNMCKNALGAHCFSWNGCIGMTLVK